MAPAPLKIGLKLIGAGCARIVHGIVPGVLHRHRRPDGHRNLSRLYGQKSKAGSTKPKQWSDYDI